MKQESLFAGNQAENQPLASRVRPQTLDQFVGQHQLVGKGKVLREIIESDQLPSIIFWGPPGVGKTTLAEIIAKKTQAKFVTFSAVTSGIKEIRDIMKDAEANREMGGKTIVFVDEIHRFNKAQQDAFLPFVERGSITLIGATTENPSFEINSALLSRCKVFVLQPLETDDIVQLIHQTLNNPAAFPKETIEIDDDAVREIAEFANGDARVALNTFEMAVNNSSKEDGTVKVSTDNLHQLMNTKSFLYDKHGEEHTTLFPHFISRCETAIRMLQYTG